MKEKTNMTNLERLSRKITKWIGTPQSIIIHTLIFIGIPCLTFLGFDFRTVSIILTTWLSMEAIYLSIFIQMTVNRNTESIEDLQEDVEDIQEDVEDLEEGIGKGIHTTGQRIQKFLGLRH